jgi:general secretion pathway protein E
VFSTIHTIDAAGAITRLVDMGVEPFKIGSSLCAVVAQRLIRRLCMRCRQAYEPTDTELAEIGLTRDKIQGHTIYRSKGCVYCNDTGYSDRTAIFECLVIDDDIRRMITGNIDSKTIENAAVRKGMTNMRMYGASKVVQGITSIAEVLRQTEQEVD